MEFILDSTIWLGKRSMIISYGLNKTFVCYGDIEFLRLSPAHDGYPNRLYIHYHSSLSDEPYNECFYHVASDDYNKLKELWKELSGLIYCENESE